MNAVLTSVVAASAPGGEPEPQGAEERHLLVKARTGDHHARARLFELHARTVFRVCMRILNDVSLAEDAVQNTFVQALNHLHQFEGTAPFGAWLRRIASNAAIAVLRARKPAELLEVEYVQHGQEDHLHQRDRERLNTEVTTAMTELTALERAAFILRHVEHHSLQEIAVSLGSNSNAIKQALFRALKKMRQTLEPLRQELLP